MLVYFDLIAVVRMVKGPGIFRTLTLENDLMAENNLLSLIIFAPLVGAVINWIVGKRVNSELFSGTVACSAVGISTVVAFMIAFGIGTEHEGASVCRRRQTGSGSNLDLDTGWQISGLISDSEWTVCREFTPALSHSSVF